MRLTDDRYERIKRKVVDFIKKNNIDTYPLDCYKICEKLNIPLVKYSSLNKDERDFVESKSGDAYIVKTNDNKPVGIVYNDDAKELRIPTNLAHELGHIGMGHKEHSMLADVEADFFGVYFLAPNPLMERYDIQSFEDVYNKFNVSMQVAINAFNRYTIWKRWRKKNNRNYEDYEQELLDFIK